MLATHHTDKETLIRDIKRLKQSLNAVILAHYYQDTELQDLADFIGDSLELSRKAAETDADVIIFCGVRFMAEVAKILNPDKLVLIPDMNAGCSLEESCPAPDFKAFVEAHPNHLVLSYINCSIGVKALSDVIVTSSSAEKIVNTLPKDQPIIFAPDKYLGAYINKQTGRDMLLWDGTCVVHERFSEKEIIKLKTQSPDAYVIAHPECPEHILEYADHVGSTSSLIAFTHERPSNKFIVLTEPGIIHQMKKASPKSIFYAVDMVTEEGSCTACNVCPYMKLNTLEKLYHCMLDQTPAIEVDEQERMKAFNALQRMFELAQQPETEQQDERKRLSS